MKLVEADEPVGAVPPPGAGAGKAPLRAGVAVEVSSRLDGTARDVCSAIACWGADRAADGQLATVCVASDTSELGDRIEITGSLCAASSGSRATLEAGVRTLGEEGVVLRETGASSLGVGAAAPGAPVAAPPVSPGELGSGDVSSGGAAKTSIGPGGVALGN